MNPNEKYFDIGVKYGLPLIVIAATLAMKTASGWGKFGVFALSTPIMILSLKSLGRAKKGKLFNHNGSIRRDTQWQN